MISNTHDLVIETNKTKLTTCKLFLFAVTAGEHVAVHPPGGAPSHPRNRHGSGHLHTDGGDRSFQSGGGTDSGLQVQVVEAVGGTLHGTDQCGCLQLLINAPPPPHPFIQWNQNPTVALAEDDDLHVGQHNQLHRHLRCSQHSGPQTGEWSFTARRLLLRWLLTFDLEMVSLRAGPWTSRPEGLRRRRPLTESHSTQKTSSTTMMMMMTTTTWSDLKWSKTPTFVFLFFYIFKLFLYFVCFIHSSR